jgi:alpha,alpha-trehalase
VRVEFQPRFDYGLTVPRLERRGEELFVVYGGADALVLQTSFPLEQVGPCTAEGTTRLRSGEGTTLVLTYSLPHELDPQVVNADEIDRRFRETEEMWREWADRCEYEGPYREEVVRSALVLKALTNAPTGAIVAAPTTSLPEQVGGERNWDYRYTWVRDAAFTIYALFSLGYREEAHRFMHWLERTVAGQAEDLQIMYAVAGERQLHEIELGHLEGYRGSRPVRIGNGAAGQFQLDVYGEVLDTGWQYLQHGGEIEPGYWELCVGAVEYVAEHWERPDAGIWETRGGPRHFVYSKVMAWVALDRGIRLAEALGWEGDVDRWRGVRDRMRARIESEGVDPGTGAFTQAFGSSIQDAANLRIPVVRFLPADDPRVLATTKQVEAELMRDGFVHRYRGYEDGLEGEEAAFVICGFWMVDNLAMAGELERARELFRRLCDSANDVGLLAEEVDPHTGELLGNFPQAFSHIGLINAAVNIARAENEGYGQGA